MREVRNRWSPQLPLALALAPLGLLLIASAAEQALGGGPEGPGLAEIEGLINPLHHGPVLELALGISVVAISIGIALRSQLAWLWSIGALTGGLSLRLPPNLTDLPLVIYMAGMIALLVYHRRRFSRRSVATSGLFATVVLVTFLVWATLGTLRLGDHFEPPIKDLGTAFYFTIVAVSSVGFGDIVARDPEARLFVAVMIVIGIIVGATALSSILGPLIGVRLRQILGGKADVERSNHYVIVGMSPLARTVTLELEKRGRGVTLVLDRAPAEDFYRQRDVVIGDATDLSVLRAAGAQEAKGVLALSPNDSDNGFVVLGVNELDATIPTVAALNDPANQFRLKRTQPSILLSLQALGGQLLAMLLTGERVDLETLPQILQIPGFEPKAAAEADTSARVAKSGETV